MLVVPADGVPALVAPRLEAMAAEASPACSAGLVEIVAWDETDDPYALVAARVPGNGSGTPVLVDPGLPARHVLALQHALPGRAFGLVTRRDPRAADRQDRAEIELLRRAAAAADRVVGQIAAGPLVGRTEADVSREVEARLVAEGHEAASFAIVASGPNSASPHHAPGERTIEPGDPIVLDIGGTVSGYGSDITRMLWVTGGDPHGARAPSSSPSSTSFAAPSAACTEAVRPGVACGELDEVARRIIRDGGHGPAFIHRLGPRHRPRGARGAVPGRRAIGETAPARARVQHRAGHLPRRPVRGPDRGHRRVHGRRSGRPEPRAARPPRGRRLGIRRARGIIPPRAPAHARTALVGPDMSTTFQRRSRRRTRPMSRRCHHGSPRHVPLGRVPRRPGAAIAGTSCRRPPPPRRPAPGPRAARGAIELGEPVEPAEPMRRAGSSRSPFRAGHPSPIEAAAVPESQVPRRGRSQHCPARHPPVAPAGPRDRRAAPAPRPAARRDRSAAGPVARPAGARAAAREGEDAGDRAGRDRAPAAPVHQESRLRADARASAPVRDQRRR